MGNNLQGEGVSQVKMGEEILCPKIEVELMEVWWVLGERDVCPSLSWMREPPGSGILALNIGTLPCGRPLPHPTTLPTPLILTVMGLLPALPLCPFVSHFQSILLHQVEL